MINYFELIPDRILHSMITLEWDELKSELIAKETEPYEFIFRLDKVGKMFRAYYVHEGFEGVDYILPISDEVYQEALDNNTIPFWICDDIVTFFTPEEAVENLYKWFENEKNKNLCSCPDI